jgi:hypothetical protein
MARNMERSPDIFGGVNAIILAQLFKSKGKAVDTQTLVIIIVGILLIGLIWRVVKGMIRFVLMIGLLLVLGYVLYNVLR